MHNAKAKTPVQMIETITAEIIEAASLLETIYKNTDENPETDCAINCLLRSLYHTKDKANRYVTSLQNHPDVTYKTYKIAGNAHD